MKPTYILILFLIVLSCSSGKTIKQKKCPIFYINNYSKILNEKYKTIIGYDTISYNEIRFACVNSAFYTHKVMFDKFGKWAKAIYPSNKKHPVLMWDSVDLFSNGIKYTVLTYGIEKSRHTYASVMVFDKYETDLLTTDSPIRESLTNYFAKLINKHNTKKKDFYEVYWKMVDPKHWEKIKG